MPDPDPDPDPVAQPDPVTVAAPDPATVAPSVARPTRRRAAATPARRRPATTTRPRGRSAADPHPVTTRGPASWSTKQVTLFGVVLSAVVTLIASVLPTALGRTSASDETDVGTRDIGVGLEIAVEGSLTSITHLVSLITAIDPADLGTSRPRSWVIDTPVRTPSGALELSVTQAWSALQPAELSGELIGTQVVGWSQPTSYGFLDGAGPGIALASLEAVDPAQALLAVQDWPSTTCQVAAHDQAIPITDVGTAAVLVLSGCREQGAASYAWFQLALTLDPRTDGAERTTEVLTMSVTSTADLHALAQILGSLHVTRVERQSSESGSL